MGTFDRATNKSEKVAQIDLFGELEEIAKTSPTFERELKAFLLRALAHHAEAKNDSHLAAKPVSALMPELRCARKTRIEGPQKIGAGARPSANVI